MALGQSGIATDHSIASLQDAHHSSSFTVFQSVLIHSSSLSPFLPASSCSSSSSTTKSIFWATRLQPELKVDVARISTCFTEVHGTLKMTPKKIKQLSMLTA